MGVASSIFKPQPCNFKMLCTFNVEDLHESFQFDFFQIRSTSPGRSRHAAAAGRRQEGGRPEQAVTDRRSTLHSTLNKGLLCSRQDVVYANAFGEWVAGMQKGYLKAERRSTLSM